MTSIDMFTRLNSEAALLRARLETLNRQSVNGQRADALGDLAPQIARTVSLRGEIGRRELYGKVMDQALGRAAVMQNSLGRLTEIARDFRTRVAMRIQSGDPGSLMTVQSNARAALKEVADLLNTRHAGEYLFGGSDLGNPPIPDPNSIATGQMAQDIAAQIAGLGANDASAVATATRAIAQSTSAGITPFSGVLSINDALPENQREVRRGVPSADGQIIGYGIPASRNGEAVSTGETTGSWARDLMRNLMSLAALTPEQMDDPAAFDGFVATIREGLSSAEIALGEEAGALGHVEARMETTKRRHGDMSSVLTQQLSAIEEVDVGEVMTRMQATRTALEASYRAIAALADLNLAKFLR